MTKVLLVDDDPGISASLGMYLSESGFEIRNVSDGDEVLEAFDVFQPDIIILDINLPNKDGITLVGELRKNSTTPILMLSARDDQRNIIECLELGADDYVSKPFSPREIISRIRAIIRRGGLKQKWETLSFKQITLDENNLQASHNGIESQLTKSEFYILKRIVEGEGNVVKREELMHEIMGYNNYVVDRTIDTHIKNIRKKLWDDIALTVRWIGYKLK